MGQSQYHTEVPYYVAPASPNVAATCDNSASLTCGDSPAIQNSILTLKLTGKYQLDKKSTVLVAYQFQQMISTDPYFNGYQLGYTPSSTLPTMQVSPNYAVNAVAVSYIYKF